MGVNENTFVTIYTVHVNRTQFYRVHGFMDRLSRDNKVAIFKDNAWVYEGGYSVHRKCGFL